MGSKTDNFPEKLEGFGYRFDDSGHLRKLDESGEITGQPFEYEATEDEDFNLRRYEALSEVIAEYVYDLLEKEGLERLPLPKNLDDATFIFGSKNAEMSDKLIILIPSRGSSSAGIWSKRLVINESLDTGTQIPYIRKAIQLGYGVYVLNTPDKYTKDLETSHNMGSRTPQEHANTFWNNYILGCRAHKIAIIAHGYGGIVTMSLASQFEDDFLNRVFAIALTDSLHGKIPRAVPSNLAKHLVKIGRNWASTEHFDPESQDYEIRSISANTSEHELTPYFSLGAIFRFIDERNKGVANVDPLLQSRYSCCINYIMSKDNLLFNI